MDDWKVANPGKPVGEGGRQMVQRMNDSHKPLRDWAFSFLEWKHAMWILDVGCGGGAAIYEMLRLSKDSMVHGIDYSADCVAAASEYNAPDLYFRAFIEEGDVGALPYDADKFDLVTAVETVYFWPDLSAGMKQILRVLKPGGTFAILCEVDGPERMDWDKVNFDIKVYRPEELKELLEQIGFVDVETHVKENGYMLVTGKK
ncbi:MAG: class I SAM-dependent methyltransferase [Eubacterium sp.]|nr:class I SAM-dependent methyltransferase [Eubacterium sp.]